MKKNYLVFLMMIFLFSCSSVGKRTVAESEVVSKDIVIERGIVSRKNIGVYKRGYRNWRLFMYGKDSYYIVNVTEDGKIFSSSKEDYK